MSLKVIIGASYSKVTEAFRTVETKAKSAAAKIKGAFSKNPFFGLSAGITSIAGMLGIGLGVRAFKGMIDHLDRIGKMSRNLGVTAEQFQFLEFAAKRSGTEIGNVETAMKQAARLKLDALSGKSKAQEVFTKLGVEPGSMKGGPFEQFQEVAKALASVKDESRRAALAQKIFGDGGVEMLDMIVNLQNLNNEFKNLKVAIPNETVAAAERFEDAWTNIITAIESAAVNSGLVGLVEKFATDIDTAVKYIADVGHDGVDVERESPYRTIARGLIDMSSPIESLSARWNGKKTFGEMVLPIKDQISAPATTVAEMKEFAESRGQKLDPKYDAVDPNMSFVEAQKIVKKQEKKSNPSAAVVAVQQAAQQKADEEKAAAEKAENDKALIADLNERLKKQRMIIAGKKRELFIDEELKKASARQARELTEDEKKLVSDQAGQLYDIENPDDAAKKAAKSAASGAPDRPIYSDELLRIGGSLGGQARGQDGAMDQMRKSNDLLGSLKEIANQIHLDVTTGNAANAGGTKIYMTK
ncbi:MAG: hypothetical protein VB042_10500 [Victivallaceae bacterium]|nr:hypothetical protein [Victivallaceae bacterium]